MGKFEKVSAPARLEPVASLVVPARVVRRGLTEPPAPRAPLVVARLRSAQRELADLKLQIPERALASAEGKPGARENLAELCQKISATEFEIGCNPAAREFAIPIDQAAAAAWKAEVQGLDPADIVDGITKEQCCSRCRPGACVITASDPFSGPCQHPVLVGALELTRYRENPRIQALHSAACSKLGLKRHA
jgi:hypothetical protein